MFALLNKRLKNNGLVMGISKSKLNCNARVLKVESFKEKAFRGCIVKPIIFYY